MKLLVTGVCGFVGCRITLSLLERFESLDIVGIDNFSRPGSWFNVQRLQDAGVKLIHGDVRCVSDLSSIENVDWVLDAAANPTVTAGVDAQTTSRQLVETNLYGTVNLLEFCRERDAGIVLLSTSRVYSIAPLSGLKMRVQADAFVPDPNQDWPVGVRAEGVAEGFATTPPISLYGATKLASEQLALEYGEAFGFPVWVNRCGVLAGAGQLAHPGQGIFAFWIHCFREGRPLKYIGFDGGGHQVRDCLHPTDVAALVAQQMQCEPTPSVPRIVNVAGGRENSKSLKQLSAWCADRYGAKDIEASPAKRPYDLPWVVLDSALAQEVWDWTPSLPIESVLEEIADHADKHPDWLQHTSK